MRGGKWSPEEGGPTGMVLPSSPPPSASVDRDSVKTCALGNQDSFFLFFFPRLHQYFMFPADQNEGAGDVLGTFAAVCQKSFITV